MITSSILKEYLLYEEQHTWEFIPKHLSRVIITIPHDGTYRNHDLRYLYQPRKEGVFGPDKHIAALSLDILPITQIIAIRGLLPRGFVDYNRSLKGDEHYDPCLPDGTPEKALEDSTLQNFYHHYHDRISASIKRMGTIFGKEHLLLLDIHGYKTQPLEQEYDLILGTGNKSTVQNKVDESFAWFFQEKNYKVFLPDHKPRQSDVDDPFNGAFTVRYHTQEHNINGIQIEIAPRFRTNKGKELGKKLASDIASFIEFYNNLHN